MKKLFLILILNSGILIAQSASFDPSIQIESQLDTTSFKIGEKIDYSIKISHKNKYYIKFSEKPNFLPFEVLESFGLPDAVWLDDLESTKFIYYFVDMIQDYYTIEISTKTDSVSGFEWD